MLQLLAHLLCELRVRGRRGGGGCGGESRTRGMDDSASAVATAAALAAERRGESLGAAPRAGAALAPSLSLVDAGSVLEMGLRWRRWCTGAA